MEQKQGDPAEKLINVSWQKQNIINIFIVLMLVGIVIYGVIVRKKMLQAEHDAKIQKVVIEHVSTINADSIATLIEARYQDSLSAIRATMETKLNQLKKQNDAYYKTNKKLRDSFDNISIDRPEY